MRPLIFLTVALFATTLLCTGANAQNVPSANKEIEKSIKSLKSVLNLTKNPADKVILAEAITALEKVVAKKALLKEGDKKKVYTRAAFKKLVVGKSKDQIRQLFGKPERTIEFNDNEFSVAWTYKNLTRDPDAVQIDPNANILFDVNGIAVSVDFVRLPF